MKSYDNISNECLMARFVKDSDEYIFKELVDRHFNSAIALAKGMLGNRELARDAVQESFLRVIRKKDTYNPSKSFSSWYFTILRNICTDIYRKEARLRDKHKSYAREYVNKPYSSENIYGYDLLNKLTESQRNILVLRLIQGMSFVEIAEVMNCSVEAAKKRAQRALKSLREISKKECKLAMS